METDVIVYDEYFDSTLEEVLRLFAICQVIFSPPRGLQYIFPSADKYALSLS